MYILDILLINSSQKKLANNLEQQENIKNSSL